MEKKNLFSRIMGWIRKEYEKLKPMTGKQRLEYFRMYYLTPLLITAFVGTIAIAGIVTVIANSDNEVKLYVHVAGLVDGSYSQWVQDYEDARGYDENQSIRMTQGQFSADNAMFTQSVNIFAATESLDVLICDDDSMAPMISMGLARDLAGLLEEETSAMAEDKLGWIEMPIIDHDGNVEEMLTGYYYIDITGSVLAQTLSIEGNAYLMACISTPRPEEFNEFVRYVLTQ